MGIIKRIFHDRIDGPERLNPEEREQVRHDPRLLSAMAENRALRALHEDPGPAPDRSRLLDRVYLEAELMEEPRMSLLHRLFAGKRWYAQTGLALGVLVIICALAVFLPTDSSMKPPPAWGQTNGYKLDYNLGRVSPQLVNAALDVSGGSGSPADGRAYVSSSSKVNVVTTKDLSEEQLQELKEALSQIIDGEIKVISAENLDLNSGDLPEGITIVISDPDIAEIERIIAGSGSEGEIIELEGIKILRKGGTGASEIEFLITRPETGAANYSIYIDPAAGGPTKWTDLTELRVTLDGLGTDDQLADALAAAGEGLRLVQMDNIYINGSEMNAEAMAGLKAAQEGLAAVDLRQLQSTLSDEEYAEIVQTIEDARGELAAIDMETLVVDLRELDGAELEANLAEVAEQLQVVRAELSAVDLTELRRELGEIQGVVAGEEMKRALMYIGESNLDDVVMRVDEVNTIDLSELENAIENFKLYKVGADGAPVKVVTKVVDGNLIATIAYGAEDAAALEDLKVSMSQWFDGLPDPQVTTSTWFYDTESTEAISTDGVVINLKGHSFQFPDGADPAEIQSKIDVWFKESLPDGAVAPTVKVVSGPDGQSTTYVIVTDGTEAGAAGYIQVSEGDFTLSSGKGAATAVTVTIEEDEETGEHIVYIDGKPVEPDEEADTKEIVVKKKKDKQ